VTISCPHPRPKLDLPGYAAPRLSWQPPAVIPQNPADMSRVMREALQGIYNELLRAARRRNVVPLIESMDAREGQIIVGVADGQVIKLPEAGETGEFGTVTVVVTDVKSPATLVNPDGSTLLLDQPGSYEVGLGQEDTAWQGPPGVTSSGSMGGAAVVLGAAHASFPNGRVATDSAEVDADLTTPSAISWALNVASVAFSKLANLTGLSVLGRAANSTGVMAAITASTAGQVLQVNAAGNALQWGNPLEVWSPAGVSQGFFSVLDLRSQTSIIFNGGAFGNRWQVRPVRAALTGAITAAQDDNATAFGALAAKSVLANATNASAIPAALAGSIAFQHLRVNSGNTGLEWSVFTSGDFPAGVVPVSSIAAIAADTFIGNTGTISASPAAIALSSIGSTSLVYDATSHTFQRAALTGAVTASQNSNATTLATQAANTFLANATAGVASPTAVASNAEGVMGRTSGNIQSIDSSVQTALIRAAGSVFWASCAADQTLRRSGSGDLGFGTLVTNNIGANQVTNARLAQMATDTFKGNVTAGTADPADVGLSTLAGAGLSFAAHTLDVNGSTSITITSDQVQRAALTGAIAASANANATLFAGIRDNGSAENDRTNLNFLSGTSIIAVVTDDSVNDELELTWQRAALSGVVVAAQDLNTTTFGTNIVNVPLVETALSGPSVSAGGGTFWTRNTAPTRGMFTDDESATWELIPNRVGSNSNTVSATNTTGSTTGAQGSLQANSAAVGTIYKCEGYIVVSRGATATACNLTVEIVLGGTSYAAAAIVIPTTISTVHIVHVVGYLLCRSIGAAGTFLANIWQQGDMGTAGSVNTAASATTKDTTASQTISLTASMSAAVAALSTTWTHAVITRMAQS
jgi:hypothetical protein